MSEGNYYRNPYAAERIANARAAGLRVGAYHYSTYSTTSEATAEANYFVDTAQSLGLSDTTYMVDDLEAESTKTSNTTQLAETFKRQVNNRGYGKTLLYTYASYTQQQGLKFNAWGDKNVWMASYPAKPHTIICGTQIMVCGNGILKRIFKVLQEHMMSLLTMTTWLQVGIM